MKLKLLPIAIIIIMVTTPVGLYVLLGKQGWKNAQQCLFLVPLIDSYISEKKTIPKSLEEIDIKHEIPSDCHYQNRGDSYWIEVPVGYVYKSEEKIWALLQ